MVRVQSLKDVSGMFSRAHMLLPGLYAWVTTVAYPAAQKSAPLEARVSAGVALVALVLAPLVAFDRPRAGRVIGVYGFVSASALTWVLLEPIVSVGRLEPIRGSLGAVGWALYAFGWGAVRHTERVPEDDPRAILSNPLKPRSELPRGATAVFAVSLVGALVPAFLAWRVSRPEHALLAHAVALAAGIAMIVSGVRVATERGSWRPVTSSRVRLDAARGPLALLMLLLAAGILFLLFR